ncbi:3-oxoacyl-[acyl-carrier-protein] reductase [Bavariicoccus seileri]|uniref:3-oxoacyl-[acyl-carrier-protein] reductase n=1 Tax=Bavariicoccus seileri TaxID=549685 RepID=UPI003F939E31
MAELEKQSVAFITGGTKGIGLAIAQKLYKDGYQVILTSRHAPNEETLASFVGENDSTPVVLTGSVADSTEVKDIIDEIFSRFKRLDVIVNNAGITLDKLILRMSAEDFMSVIETNLLGTFNVIKAVTPYFLKQKNGVIINMASVVGITGNAGQTNYAASKAGIIGLTKSVAKELAGRNIRCNAIAPGFIETDMTAKLNEKQRSAILQEIPLKRFGQVDHISETVSFLIQNDYVTGQVIEVNGGLHM